MVRWDTILSGLSCLVTASGLSLALWFVAEDLFDGRLFVPLLVTGVPCCCCFGILMTLGGLTDNDPRWAVFRRLGDWRCDLGNQTGTIDKCCDV